MKELGIKRSQNDCPVVVTIPYTWGIPDIQKLVQIMFETINVPGLYIADSPLMACFGCGILSGVVIDIGYQSTSKFFFFHFS